MRTLTDTERAVVATAREVAQYHGLSVVGELLVDRRGDAWGMYDFACEVAARLGYEGQPRQEHGKFGEGKIARTPDPAAVLDAQSDYVLAMDTAKAMREDAESGHPQMPETRALLAGIDAAPLTTDVLYHGSAEPGTPEEVAARYTVGEQVHIPLASFSKDQPMAEKFGQWSRNERPGGAQETTEVMYWMSPGAHGLPVDYQAIQDNLGHGIGLDDEREVTIGDTTATVTAVQTYEKRDVYDNTSDPRTAVRVILKPVP